MPYTKSRHREGGDHWVVRVPNAEWSGKRLGVVFVEGVGRTTNAEKAQFFAESLKYSVTAPPRAVIPPLAEDKRPTNRAAWDAAPEKPIVFVSDADPAADDPADEE